MEQEYHQLEANDQINDNVPPSAHIIGHDSWQQVGLMLVTSLNCGYILSFSNLMLVPLGWTWGIICMLIVGFYTAYANWLLAAFHFVNGQRFIRYRDLMGYCYGRKMYYITWVFQFMVIILGNMGFILFGGEALKEVNSILSDHPLRLQYFIVITGMAFFMFAFFIPTMSAMRTWIGVSTIITFSYTVILLAFMIKEGKTNSEKEYEIPGSKVGKVFNGLGAISAIVACNTTGLLLEIQSTLREPAVKNMRKAIYLQYSVGLIFYYGVSVVGYWAYGSAVSEYLPKELQGPKWIKILINLAVFLQTIVSQHMYVTPIHEALDTNFLKLEESIHSKENVKRRFFLRLAFFTGNTFVAAALPFIANFVNLFGSLALIPVTFVFPSLIFLKVKGKTARLEQNLWHCFNVVLFSLLSIVTTISAIRLIVNNVRQYNFFADS
ncbi:Amino acid transporter, transmembrane domain containing protein [Trema orientale]|uniref:Amino acid transporter, transmembrane domain containing protein n=1 Tax=Trema orientale TaxID=63057 RepID=A0A2P5EI62_TREOI|nr:Amino acid transporter, transmembrane domain containing protein [Trema orientale]